MAEQDCVKKSFEDEGIVIALLEIVNDGDTVSSCTYQISSANLRELDLGNDCHIASPWLYFMHDKKTQEIGTLTVASANDSTTNNNKYLEISNLPLSARLCVTLKYVNGHRSNKIGEEWQNGILMGGTTMLLFSLSVYFEVVSKSLVVHPKKLPERKVVSTGIPNKDSVILEVELDTFARHVIYNFPSHVAKISRKKKHTGNDGPSQLGIHTKSSCSF